MCATAGPQLLDCVSMKRLDPHAPSTDWRAPIVGRAAGSDVAMLQGTHWSLLFVVVAIAAGRLLIELARYLDGR